MIDIQQLHDLLPQSKFELVSDVAATIAVVSPWWLPYLKETSEVAAFLLPVFGIIWLVIQIYVKLHFFFNHRNDIDDAR